MRFWEFDEKPYRPVADRQMAVRSPDGDVQMIELEPDVFVDANGRLWYAETRYLRDSLPSDPLAVDKIPPQFWHPDARRKHSDEIVMTGKRRQEDERIDNRPRPTLV